MKSFYYLPFILIMLIACESQQPEFKKVAKDVSYKYLKFGEGEKVRENEYLMVYLTVMDKQGDTLHYLPNYPYFLELGKQAIDSVWKQLGEGDSVHILTKRAEFNRYLKLHNLIDSDKGELLITASIQRVMDSVEAVRLKREMLSSRELQEQLAFKRFIQKSEEDWQDLGGIYRIILNRTDGDTIKYGDQLRVSYQGRFLNGYVFDDTNEKGLTPTFRYGENYQLLEGVESGLKGLKEGESVKIILPSRRAFGEKGSLAGIVPPYTSVIFEIKILKIEK